MTFRDIRSDQKSTELLFENVKKSPSPRNWHNLPHHILGDIHIMTMIGRKSLQDLQKGRQVCQSWNVMISQMIKDEKDTIRRLFERLRVWLLRKRGSSPITSFFSFSPITIPEIRAAASLAHHGLLGSVFEMWLRDVDLTSVPAEHLASLASCVTQFFLS